MASIETLKTIAASHADDGHALTALAIFDAAERIATLERELAEARKDTLRIEFLDNAIDPDDITEGDGGEKWGISQGCLGGWGSDSLREAIDGCMDDAAMAGEG